MYCILVSGMPASGKSKFAEYLCKELELPMMSKDKIKELLYDTVGFNSRSEKVALGNGSMEILYYFAESMMSIQQPFILENNFENISKHGIEALLSKYSYTPINVRFGGDLRIIYERFIKRNLSSERHLGHVLNSCYPPKEPIRLSQPSMEFDAFVRLVKERGMLDFSVGGIVIDVNTSDFGHVNYYSIISDLKDTIKTLV